MTILWLISECFLFITNFTYVCDEGFNMGGCNYSINLFERNEKIVIKATIPKNMDMGISVN